MALFKITIKSSRVSNGIHLEKGMSVDVPSKYSNPVTRACLKAINLQNVNKI